MEKLLKISKGFGISIIFFILLNILTAVLLRYTNLPEKLSIIFLVVTMTVCCMILCIFVGNAFSRRGLLLGIIFSSAYLVLLIYLLVLEFDTNFQAGLLKPIYIIPVIGGAIGGIVGTNLKK